MFKNVLETTPLTTDAAESYFTNIRGRQIFGDTTFVGTLRALVAPRIGKDETVQLCYSESSYGRDTVNGNPARNIIDAMIGSSPAIHGNKGIIELHNLRNYNDEDNKAIIEMLKGNLPNRLDGWYRIPKVTDFFRKTFYVLCFINPELKSVLLFTEQLDARRLHYLQCSIFAFMPWYFDPSVGVTELEMALINSLRDKTPETYLECMTKIASQYDFRTERIKNLLKGFEAAYEKIELEEARSELEDAIRRIEDYNNRISQYLERKRNFESKILGLELSIQKEEGESEIMEYFLCNKKLVLESCDERNLTFGCMDYLTYFDEEMAKKMIDNSRSYVYRPDGRDMSGRISADDMKKLMYALFVDQTLRMKMCSAYRFRIGGNVEALAGWNYGHEYSECTPNTHIDRYRCMGNHQRVINELLAERNYIGALEQAISSCKSINFGDSPVMNEFMLRLYGYRENINIKCIELPTGEIVKPQKAIEWLKAQETQANNEEVSENE